MLKEVNNGRASIVLSPLLKKAANDKAREQGTTLSDYIRKLILRDLVEI